MSTFNSGRGRLALVLVVAVIAIGGVSAHRYATLERELTDAALARRASVAALAATILSEKFERLIDIGVSLATRVRFQELIAAERWVEAAQILRRVPEDFEFFDRVFIADAGGTLRADAPELPGARGTNFSDREWYRGVNREWKPFVSQLYRRAAAPQRNVIAVSVPIHGPAGKIAGILVLQVKIETFFGWARQIDVGPEDRVLVVDGAGRAAFDSTAPVVAMSGLPASLPESESRIPGTAGAEILSDATGELLVRGFAPATHRWGVVILQPARAAFAIRDSLLRQQLIGGVLVAVFALAAILFGTRILTHRRREEMDRVHREALDKANRQLGESEERLNFALHKSHIGGWDLDLVNHSAHRTLEHDRIFGYSALLPEWTYETFLGHVLQEDRAGVDQRFRDAIAAQSEWSFECRIRRVDGEVRWILATGEHQRDEAGNARRMAGIVQDITERKRAEQDIRDLNASLELRVAERTQQLVASNKELESFSYSVSHDLRAPLRAVDGFSRIVQEDYGGKLDAEGRRLLDVIRDNSRKMGQLIDDLLEYSRLGRRSLASNEIDMKQLVEEVLGDVQLSSERPPRLLLGALPPARGDATLLKQVWVNLLANAIKFSAKHPQPVIEVSGNENGTESVYCIRDNGAGFDMKYYDKLFGVFQRLHREEEFEGTGVGLAIVQRVVTRHGGRVWAEGKVGEGAAFFFALPKGGA